MLPCLLTTVIPRGPLKSPFEMLVTNELGGHVFEVRYIEHPLWIGDQYGEVTTANIHVGIYVMCVMLTSPH
jgi:hypothetical protein